MHDVVQKEKNAVSLPDRLSLSPEEACALSGIGVTRIREAVGSGALVAHKHGTRTIILPDDLKAWLKAMPLAAE
jgi:excisionase family DNA binding protein